MRTNKIKDRLLREHDRLNQVLKELQQIKNKDPARAWELFLEFKSGLLRHIAWKEEILFPLIECRTDMHMPGPAIRVRVEHQQIKERLEQITDQIVRSREGIEYSEASLINLLTIHSDEEEKILYPWIEMTLTEADQDAALDQMDQLTWINQNK